MTMDQPVSDEDGEPPARSRRVAVMIFLLGWLFVPLFAILLGELPRPWFEVGCVAMLAFIAVFVVATVRAVRF
jgi:hypothetical protein